MINKDNVNEILQRIKIRLSIGKDFDPSMVKELLELVRYEYQRGFTDGICTYAYWKDGEEFVGTTGKTLRKAISEIENTYNFDPPIIN